MFVLDRILVPVDFSERSAAALHYSAVLGRQFQSELVLLHALPPVLYYTGMDLPPEYLAESQSTALGELKKMSAAELGGLRSEEIVTEGAAALAIINYVAGKGADLIVMPMHGYGALRQFFLGSTATTVLETVECPVLTGAHLSEETSAKFANIVCAVDLGPKSAAVIEWASHIAGGFGARLFLVHVSAELEAATDEAYFEGRGEAAAEAMRQLNELRSNVGVASVPIVVGGEPVEAVLQQARELSADLLVVGRGAIREGFTRRLRAHSGALIREAHCAVLSV